MTFPWLGSTSGEEGQETKRINKPSFSHEASRRVFCLYAMNMFHHSVTISQALGFRLITDTPSPCRICNNPECAQSLVCQSIEVLGKKYPTFLYRNYFRRIAATLKRFAAHISRIRGKSLGLTSVSSIIHGALSTSSIVLSLIQARPMMRVSPDTVRIFT